MTYTKQINTYKRKISDVRCLFSYIEKYIAIKNASGIYSFTPFGLKLKNFVENIIRENHSYGQEVSVPSILETKLYNQSGRNNTFNSDVFNFKNKFGSEYSLCATAEEIFITTYINNKISYKNLPVYYYQIGKKFRDETRPRNALLRTYEFIMKDGYYFTTSYEDLDAFYQKIKQSYIDILNKLKIKFTIIPGDTEEMIADNSEQFIAESDVTETEIIHNNEVIKGVEVAHIFNLGTKYSDKLEVKFINSNDNLCPIIMGSYGIGVSRLIFLIAEKIYTKQLNNISAPFRIAFIPRSENNQLINSLYQNNKNISLYDNDFSEKFNLRIQNCIYYGVKFIVFESSNGDVKILNVVENIEMDISNICSIIDSLIE